MRQIRAAGVILYRPGPYGPAFLLLRASGGGHWGPPKGHLRSGETEIQAALRETEEESGLHPQALEPAFREEVAYEVVRRGERVPKTVAYYLGEASNGEVRLSREHVDFHWATLQEARATIALESLRAVIEAAARRLAARAAPA